MIHALNQHKMIIPHTLLLQVYNGSMLHNCMNNHQTVMTMIIEGATLLGVSSGSMVHDQKEQTEMIIKTHGSES